MPLPEFQQASCCNPDPLTIIPIHLQRCANTFGNSPCTATGEPCYETWETCKDKCNFNCEIRDNTHTTCPTSLLDDVHRPDIKDVSYSGGKLKLCEGMPSPRTVTVTLKDGPGCDFIDDPYLSQRNHDSQLAPGTELEKFSQRHILEGRGFDVLSGFCGTAYPNDFIKRNYFIDSFNGPDSDSCYTLKGKDAFGFFNLTDFKWPAEVTYKTTISLPATAGVGSQIVLDSDAPTNAEAICIGSEAIRVEYVGPAVNGQRYQVLERGACGSEIADHDAGATVTIAGYFREGTNIGDVIFTLLTQKGEGLPWVVEDCDCGPFQEGVIDLESFSDFIGGCGRMYKVCETIICKPTSVRELLKEIDSVFLVKPVINEFTGKIELYQHTPPVPSQVVNYSRFVNDEISTKIRASDRITKTVIKAFPEDCTKGVADDNLSNQYISLTDAAFGTACTNPGWRPQKIKEVKTRFISDCNRFLGNLAIQRLDYLRRRAPREITFQVIAKDLQSKSSDYITVEHRDIQDVSGAGSKDYFWVTDVRQVDHNCFEITAEASGFTTDQEWFGYSDDDCMPMTETTTDDCAEQCQKLLW